MKTGINMYNPLSSTQNTTPTGVVYRFPHPQPREGVIEVNNPLRKLAYPNISLVAPPADFGEPVGLVRHSTSLRYGFPMMIQTIYLLHGCTYLYAN